MIIVRSPLRISLGGGGTDLPSYYKNSGGFLVAAAIDKYVYVTITKPFVPGIFLKYSDSEKVASVDKVKHNIIRETLRLRDYKNPQIEITTLSDIPAGTGLGSSGSFTTALLKSLKAFDRMQASNYEIAEEACHIEMNILKEPIGKQDQYISSIGGITSFVFHKNDEVISAPLNLDDRTLNKLEDNLLLFFTGYSRSASQILKDQNEKTLKNDDEMIKNLDYIKSIGFQSKNCLENGNLEDFGRLMHEHWTYKKNRSTGMSNDQIDIWYSEGIKSGALGGKVVGAGGGGFLLFYTNDPEKLRLKMAKLNLEEVRFKFDFEGTKQII